MRSVVFPAHFPKECFPTHPTGKHEKAASPVDRKDWVPPAPATLLPCPGSWEGGPGDLEKAAGSLPCHHSANPDKAS